MSFIEKWAAVLQKPQETFAAEKPNASFGNAFTQLLLGGVIGGIFLAIMTLIFGGFEAASGNSLAAVAHGVAGILGLFIFPILFPLFLIFVGVLVNILNFIFSKLVGGQGTFSQQFYLWSLYTAPIMVLVGLFSQIPYLGAIANFLIGIFGLVMLFWSLKEVHQYSSFKAIVVMILPGLVLIALVIGFVVFFYAGIFNPSKDLFEARDGPGVVPCGGFGVFSCSARSQSSGFVLELKNALGRTIEVKDVTALGFSACTFDGKTVPANGLLSVSCINPALTTAMTFDTQITVIYTDPQSGLERADTGGFVMGRVL
ncbi:MAG: YIP1 family protein [Candidatus Micrarchaeota archaeon]